jgi:spermidine/putrescine transport system ATP-binding protein
MDDHGETPSVELRSVTKRFDQLAAVDDLSLELGRGEFFTLLGPSGCGKTTTLRMVAGFERPTSGEIRIEGEDVAQLPPHKRPTNTVFQSYALFPHLSVEANVAFGLKRKKVAKKEIAERVRAELERVGLAAEAKRRPSQLSGGMQQRVALARALVNLPKVLLLDEPLGALDLKLRKELQVELKGIQRDVGITFVYVTHDQEEALTMSDRIAVMNEGRVQQVAEPNTLYELPRNRFVANFIGQTNVFSGTVESVDADRVTLRTRGGTRVEAVTREGIEVEVGAEAQATVRPEKVRFGSAGDNVSNAKIRQIVYLGVSTQYIAELSDGTPLVLYQQNTQDSVGPDVKEEVPVAWDARNCLVLGG